MKIDTAVDVPIGIRRRDELFSDFKDSDEVLDPDVWPSPTPVDHRYVNKHRFDSRLHC